jgi:hypothetical protein
VANKIKKITRKKINFELITDMNSEPYRVLAAVRKEHHSDLHKARIALAWRKGFKPDTDGHLVLGKCVKAPDLQRELVDWDFVILLNREVWMDQGWPIEKKRALLDHELCHAARAEDEYGAQKEDERGRLVWRIRKHDIEEFQEVVTRHGCYKRDLENFARALLKSKNTQSLFDGNAKGTAA